MSYSSLDVFAPRDLTVIVRCDFDAPYLAHTKIYR
ncbi:MAG: hypothetical protein UZ21_OP11001000085 [Microgenomates bacterium OLB22]|nr:MAG: hypothetical protein UZ21_OP11001000085 [Microgenomates bacterium OLB22]